MSFAVLKEKAKEHVRQFSYEDTLLNIVASTFESNLPFNYGLFECIVLTCGVGAFANVNGNYIYGMCNFTGDIDEDGWGKDLTIITLSNKMYDFPNYKENKKVCVIKNNFTGCPDLNISRFATMFSQVDKSMVNNVVNARSHPIYRANTEKERNTLNALLETDNERPYAIVSANFWEEGQDGKVINLTDPQLAEKLQFLSQFEVDLERRFFQTYGISVHSSTKLAQMTVDEVNNGCEASRVLVEIRKKCRQIPIEKFNADNGTQYFIDYSKVWEIAERKFTDIETGGVVRDEKLERGGDDENTI